MTLAFDEPRIKPAVSLAMVERFLQQHAVIYVDFDLQFSSLLQNIDGKKFSKIADSGRLAVMQPSDDVLDFIGNVSDLKMSSGGIVFLDSLNTLQALLTDSLAERGALIANQKTAMVVTVLQELCKHYCNSLLIMNLTKSRPIDANEVSSSPAASSFWEKGLVGGRMIRYKSDRIFSVNYMQRAGSSAVEIKEKDLRPGERQKNRRFTLQI